MPNRGSVDARYLSADCLMTPEDSHFQLAKMRKMLSQETMYPSDEGLTISQESMIEPLPRARCETKRNETHTHVNTYNHKNAYTHIFLIDHITFNTVRLSLAIPSSRCFDTYIHNNTFKPFVIFRLEFANPS
jgi:hypothetical protein